METFKDEFKNDEFHTSEDSNPWLVVLIVICFWGIVGCLWLCRSGLIPNF